MTKIAMFENAVDAGLPLLDLKLESGSKGLIRKLTWRKRWGGDRGEAKEIMICELYVTTNKNESEPCR